AVWTPPGRYFDGGDDFIQVGQDLFEADTSGTLIAWIKRDAIGARDYVFSSSISAGDSFLELEVFSNDKLLVGNYKAGAGGYNHGFYGNSTIAADTWTMCTLLSDGSTWSLYVNTTPQTLTAVIGTNTGNWFGNLPTGTHDVRAGRLQYSGGNSYFKGTIGEVWVYNRVLLAGEITRIYLNTKWRYR
ncbi:MAG: LamG domain-containing protein, partial [Chloroflexota bacterium]